MESTLRALAVPTRAEIEELTFTIACGVTRVVERIAEREAEVGGRLEETAAGLQGGIDACARVALTGRPAELGRSA